MAIRLMHWPNGEWMLRTSHGRAQSSTALACCVQHGPGIVSRPFLCGDGKGLACCACVFLRLCFSLLPVLIVKTLEKQIFHYTD